MLRILFALAAASFVLLSACDKPQASAASTADLAKVERGRYLVTILACNDCHTPHKAGPNGFEPDMTRMLSGHPEDVKMPEVPAPPEPWLAYLTFTAFSGPWGVSYAANLTPDVNTGLGIWTEEMFINALRKGRHMGVSRPIMPPMPWQYFRHMTDEDLKSIYAYLRTIPPVVNHVPEYQPPAEAEQEDE